MTTTKTDVGAHVNGVVAPERGVAAPERVDMPEQDYPDWSVIPDPEPIEDAMQQEIANTDIRYLVRAYFRNRPDVLVSGDGYLAWDRADKNIKLIPDLIVAFDVNVEEIRSRNGYLMWEVGKPPDVVMEVASNHTKDNDLTDKRDRYASLGVGEYWRLDPTGGALYGEPLVGEYLANGEYRRYEMCAEPDGIFWGYSRALGINLMWDGGGERFITQNPETGEYRIGILEVERERDAAREQAAQEREGRIRERHAREAAEARVRVLDAEIARLREQRR